MLPRPTPNLPRKTKEVWNRVSWADLAVLSQDIFRVPVENLPKTESVLTMVAGKIVYDARVVGVQ